MLAGMHFFNPATVMKLVEIISTPFSFPSTIQSITELAKRLKKVPVQSKDAPGFIVNRVARPYYLEALHLLESGVAEINTIDAVMEGRGFRMGPFKLMDLIGNDINQAVTVSIYQALGKPSRLQPSSKQRDYVSGGLLGRKSGSGFYTYAHPSP